MRRHPEQNVTVTQNTVWNSTLYRKKEKKKKKNCHSIEYINDEILTCKMSAFYLSVFIFAYEHNIAVYKNDSR